ncbi:MAG: hypothetical protein JWQ28_2135 [Pedobacter sp.]|jgi:hypothetical protein|nr:hypothetical protein [Pedobacter sp.]
MKKPITPTIHGILDYALAGVQMLAPGMLGLNKKVVKSYLDLGSGILGVNALSNTPVGLKRVISMRDHQKSDAAFLTTLTLLTFTKFIEKDQKALGFHFVVLGLSFANYFLTDYSDQQLPLSPSPQVAATDLAYPY